MRSLAGALCLFASTGAAADDDELKARLERLEAQIAALSEENRALRRAADPVPPSPAPPAPEATPAPSPPGPVATPPPAGAAAPSTVSAAPPVAAATPAAPQIKVGGQLRLRPEYRNRLKPDAAGGTTDTFYGQRARASISVGNERLRAFVEVQDARNWGTEASTVSNERNADLHQAYLNLPDLALKGLSLTVGRQELAYGDERLLGNAEWLTTARSFDGGLARYAWKGGSVDALAALVNDRKTAARGVGDMAFAGLYGRFLRDKPARELDVYALNLADSAEVAGELAGVDGSRITTVGARARHWPTTGLLASAEGAFQFGHRGTDDHTAGAWALVGGYVFDGRHRPGVRLEWDRATGDGDPKDGRSREFNNLFPTNHALYGYADLQGWRNMDALRGTFLITPRPGHQFSIDVLRFRLREARGAWKDDAGELLGQDPTGSSGRDTGDELDLLYRLPLRKEITCLLGYSAFFPGHFAESVGRKGTHSYVYVQALFRF